jgi:hypothetical protein
MKEQTVTLWKVQLESAIHCLKAAVSSNPNVRTLNKLTAMQLRASRPIIPYCLHPAGDDGKFILLNRDYLPIGNTEIKGIHYAGYEWAHVPPPPEGMLDPKNGRFYFFDDGSAPWDSLAGLERLIERLNEFLSEMRTYEQNTYQNREMALQPLSPPRLHASPRRGCNRLRENDIYLTGSDQQQRHKH